MAASIGDQDTCNRLVLILGGPFVGALIIVRIIIHWCLFWGLLFFASSQMEVAEPYG